jgi:hypothetical protein
MNYNCLKEVQDLDQVGLRKRKLRNRICKLLREHSIQF